MGYGDSKHGAHPAQLCLQCTATCYRYGLWGPALQVQGNRAKGRCSEAKDRFCVLVLRAAGWQSSGGTD